MRVEDAYYKVIVEAENPQVYRERIHLREAQKSILDNLWEPDAWTGLLTPAEADAFAAYAAVRENLFYQRAYEHKRTNLAPNLKILLAWNTRPLDELFPDCSYSLQDLVSAALKIQDSMIHSIDDRAKSMAVDIYNLSETLRKNAPLIERWNIEQYGQFTSMVGKRAKEGS